MNIANVLDFINLVSHSINFMDDEHLINVLVIPICDKACIILFSIKSIPMKILDDQFFLYKTNKKLSSHIHNK